MFAEEFRECLCKILTFLSLLLRFALAKEISRANFDFRSKAARLLQRVYRGKLGRRKATSVRMELRKCAATMIQRYPCR
jgi:hypothetical protein